MHTIMFCQPLVVALAAVLLLAAERHPAVAAATTNVPANSYPLYPYYSISWNNTFYNVTWAHTQSAYGNRTAPYPYPVIQSQGQVIPYPYPNFDYPCAKNVSGKWYDGTCSLGGRGRGNFGSCQKNVSSSTATPAKQRRDILFDFPDPNPGNDFVVTGLHGDNMPKINAPGVVTGVYRYTRPPAGGDAARLNSAVADAAAARNRLDLKAGQNSAGIRRRAALNPAGFKAPDVFDGIHQSGGANATATLTRRATKDCSMMVPGFVNGLYRPDGGGNVTGTCDDTWWTDGVLFRWTCLQNMATYDAAGVFLDMRPQNASCYAWVSSKADPASAVGDPDIDFPCAGTIGVNASTVGSWDTQGNDCSNYMNLRYYYDSASTIRQYPCIQNVTLPLPMNGTSSRAIQLATTCVLVQRYQQFPSTVYFGKPCYEDHSDYDWTKDSSGSWIVTNVVHHYFGSTCTGYDYNYEAFNATVTCNAHAARLVNGALVTSKVSSCLQKTSSWGSNQTFDFDCSRWSKDTGYSSTRCSVIVPLPSDVGTYVSSTPCSQSVPLYVNGALTQLALNLTCVTLHYDNGWYFYNSTLYWYPCQQQQSYGANGVIQSYVDTTCYQRIPGDTPIIHEASGRSDYYWYSTSGTASRYFDGASVKTTQMTIHGNGFLEDTIFIWQSWGWFLQQPAELQTWTYPCIGSQATHAPGFVNNNRVGTFAINSTLCGVFQIAASAPRLQNTTLYIYMCRDTSGPPFCQSQSAMPGVTACSASECRTLPGQSQIPYDCGAADPCLYTIGYDECVEDYQYPSPTFDAFSKWSATPAFQPARGQNGSFYYSAPAQLDATQSLTMPSLAIQSGKFDLNHSQFPGGAWSGPYWPELPVSTSSASTPVYTWPFKPASASDTSGATRPWSSFPFLPNKPVWFAPSNMSLDGLISGGIWPFSTWPAVSISMDKIWGNSIPWITFPYLRDVVQIDECSQPPASGEVGFNGYSTRDSAGYPTFVGGQQLQAWFSLGSYQCADINWWSASIYWSLDVANTTVSSSSMNQQTFESYSQNWYNLPTSNLSMGLHNVTARAIYTTSEGFFISSVIATASFTVKPVTFNVSLALVNGTVPAAWPLLLNATSSRDSYAPCLFARFISSDMYQQCANRNGYTYNDYNPQIMVFACTTITNKACPLGIQSTTNRDQLGYYGSQTNSTLTAIVVQSTANALIITTDVPYLVIPASVLVEGTYIFTFSYQYRYIGLNSPVSAPVAITVSSQKHYCDDPPLEASMTFPGKTGSTVPTFITGRGGQAVVVVSPFSCPDVEQTMIFWSGDSNIIQNPLNPWLPQAGEQRTDSLSWSSMGTGNTLGIHKIIARIVYFTENLQYLTSLVVSGTVNLVAPTFKPLLTNSNGTVSISRPLTLDATASSDNIDPCLLKKYTSDAAYRTCRSNNPGVTPYTGRVLFAWYCRTPTNTACFFQFNGTVDLFDMLDGRVSSNSTVKAVVQIPVEWTTDYNLTQLVTDLPTLTIPPESLVAGDYLWTVEYVYMDLDLWGDSESPTVAITVSSTKSYLNLQPIALGTQQATFIAGAVVRVSANASSDSVASLLTYAWTVSDTNGTRYTSAIASNTLSSSNIKINTASLTNGTYTVKLLLTDGNSNTASSSVSFSVLTSLPAPTECTVSPNMGVELKAIFAVNCPETTPGLLYAYSYVKEGVETTVKYPGSVYEELLLPAAANGPVSIYVRQFISGGKLAPSEPQILAVTVTPNPGTAADLAASLTDMLTGANTAQSAAAMDGFVGKLEKLNLSDSSTQTMVGNVVSALTSQVNANVDAPTAVSQTTALAKLLATGAVSDDSKRNASMAIQTLASVLATPGVVVAKSILESAATACLGAAVANSTDSGDAVVGSFGFLGAALMNTLAVGESATLNIPGALLQVLSIDPDATPDSLSSGSLSRRDSAAACDAQIGGTVTQILATSGSGAVVSLQANCLSQSPYPIESSALQTDALKLVSSVLSLSANVNSKALSSAQPLAQNVNVTIPTSYSPLGRLARRDAASKTTTTTYSTECLMWNSTVSAWSSSACKVMGSSAVNGTSTSCSCSHLGSYTVRLVSSSTTTTGAPDSGLVLTPAQLYGAIAGGVALIILLCAVMFVLMRKELKARKAKAVDRPATSS
ncbi:hypothetical protein HDU89_007532 [Geranomyces variabilis]|nr:hypothetical protein HDU89_007532 [Geranomyces variabilis]